MADCALRLSILGPHRRPGPSQAKLYSKVQRRLLRQLLEGVNKMGETPIQFLSAGNERRIKYYFVIATATQGYWMVSWPSSTSTPSLGDASIVYQHLHPVRDIHRYRDLTQC